MIFFFIHTTNCYYCGHCSIIWIIGISVNEVEVMGKLYDEQMRKQAETQAFREKAFNSTKTDVVRNLLTSDNIYEGEDSRNLEQYLTERNYDISAIIAGTQEVPDTIFDPVKHTEVREQKKKENSQT